MSHKIGTMREAMTKSGVEHLANHPGWKSPARKFSERMKSKHKVEHLDASDVATILAALRLFQREYEDMDAVQIADAWPMHFNVQTRSQYEDSATVEPMPLGTMDIDALCERINCAKRLVLE